MPSGDPGHVVRGIVLVVALVLGSSWLQGSVLRAPAKPLGVTASVDIPPFAVIQEGQVAVEGTGTEPEKGRLRDRVLGRLTLRHIGRGSRIDPAVDVGPLAETLPLGSTVVALRAADPLGKLRAGVRTDLLLVPAASAATPAGRLAIPEQGLAGAGEAGVIEEAVVLQVEQVGPDGLVPILVALPGDAAHLDVLRRHVGRAVAHALYTTGES
ncbi:MAG: hypothetical protein H0U10_17550 [Chloroflexia bacterium]|nr:hypothetical protein [Chloroflexia bacterium]